MNNRIYFSIDGGDDRTPRTKYLAAVSAFAQHLDSLVAFDDIAQVSGRYTHDDGQEVWERSWCVSEDDWERAIEGTHFVFNQEAVLVVDSQENATLVYLENGRRTGLMVFLGKFVQVDAEEALEAPACTYYPTTKTWFVTKIEEN